MALSLNHHEHVRIWKVLKQPRLIDFAGKGHKLLRCTQKSSNASWGDRFHGRRSVPPRCRSLECSIDCQSSFEARFQTFEDSTERAASAARVAALRAELKRRRLDASSCRAPTGIRRIRAGSDARLAWLTGFTGSAGAAIVLADRAVISSTGAICCRCATRSTRTSSPRASGRQSAGEMAGDDLPAGRALAYDPWLHSADHAERFPRRAAAGATLVPVESNPLDAVWPTALLRRLVRSRCAN